MATEPLLDLDALLAPIPGEDPGGSAVAFLETRRHLEEMRREVNIEDYPENDPLRPTSNKRADWQGIVELTCDVLQNQVKDLRLVAYLTEALVRLHGYPGLRDGLKLLSGLVEQLWDHLYPRPDEGSPAERVEPLQNLLDDPSRGLRLPGSLRSVPLVVDRREGLAFGIPEWEVSKRAGNEALAQDFARALRSPDTIECCQVQGEGLEQAREELIRLTGLLESKLGSEAPGFLRVREALMDSERYLQFVRPHLQQTESAPEADGEPGGDAAAAEAGTAGAAAATRSQAYSQLEQAAQLLLRLEPHSPIPYLILRAVQLGSMPYPRLMRALIRDDNVLRELNRELGIQEEASGESGG